MFIDQLNLDIIRHLREGRKSFKKIADALGVTENTIRARVNKLCEDGILDFTGNIDPESFKGHRLLYLGVKLTDLDISRKGEDFSRLPGVLSVAIVTGRYDIILQVLLNDQFNLLEFITEHVAKIEGVQTVESFIVYKGYNLKVPYIL
ncbi:MAG: Lrp/AsnC family transcriptional regulator [Desulfofustis sp.]|nr:Lrp/AsnC family transcriptional regulator [Desulfofustis sp.]NNK57957.1 Lrp/AsnC family transcriptional regulator [Desulfofustis sp.]